MKKTVKVIGIVLAINITILVVALFFLSKTHHREAHEKLVAYLNKEFDGQVTFRDFSLSYLRRFPKIHVEILDVAILEKEKEILKIGDLDLMLNFGSIWKRQIRIDKAILSEVTFFSEIDSLGRAPKVLAAKSPSSDSVHKALIINAKKIKVKNGLICFRNDVKRNRTRIRVHSADLKLHSTDTVFTISGVLDGHLDSLISNNSVLFADLPVKARDVSLEIQRQSGVKELKSGYLQSNSVILTPKLRLEPFEDGQLIQFQLSGGERFDALLALFRFHLGFDLAQVNPDAKLVLSYNQNGFVNAFKRPFSELDFEIADAIFEEEDLPFPVELIYAKGNYNNGEGHSPETVVLVMDTLYAEVNGSHLGGHFRLSNLNDPVIDAYLVSSLDMSHLIKETKAFSLKGMIDLNLTVNGRISEFKKLHLEGKQQAYGVINFHNLELILKNEGYSVKIHNGTTTLNNHILEFSTIAGAFDESDFLFQGYVENLDQYLLHENEQLIGDLSLNFDELDIGRFNPNPDNEKSQKQTTALPFSLVKIKLNLNGKKVVTPIGDLKNIAAGLLLENDYLTINTLHFDFQEGHVESSGQVKFDEKGIAGINAKLAADFKKLDISFPESNPGKKKKKTAFAFPDYVDAELTLKVDHGYISNVELNNLYTDISLHGHKININRFQVNAFNGSTAASGRISLDSTGLNAIWLDVSMNFGHFKPEDIVRTLGLAGDGNANKEPMSFPEKMDIRLDFQAGKTTYKDLTLSNSGFSIHASEKVVEVRNFHSGFPYGKVTAEATIADFQSSEPAMELNVSVIIDTLDLNDLLAKEYIKSLTAGEGEAGESAKTTASSPSGLPGNIDLKLELTAGQIAFDNIKANSFDLGLSYDDTKIELKKLDMEFAGGHIHLNGHLLKDDLQKYPAYVYLNARNLVLEDILEAFDNFDQENFTSGNSSGEISMASHHYFAFGRDFSFIRDANLWIGNVMIHKAKFNQVEPIEKTLFFVGHKVKDSMMVSNLNINILLNKDKLYFRDILMNDNIANLELSGYLDIDDREMDLATEISLTDLFFRSKKERIAETQEGIMTLDEDAKIFVRLYGPMSDHKIDIMKKHKFARYQADLHDKISAAEKAYQK